MQQPRRWRGSAAGDRKGKLYTGPGQKNKGGNCGGQSPPRLVCLHPPDLSRPDALTPTTECCSAQLPEL